MANSSISSTSCSATKGTTPRYMAAVGMSFGVTPPFGFALFYLRGVAPPEVPTTAIYRGVAPFIAIQLAALALLALWPDIATWLPKALYGG